MKTLESKIEAAFNNGTGDFFMQKNNFQEVIAVSEYDIDVNEKNGFEFFSLSELRRAKKENIKPEPSVEKEKTYSDSSNSQNSILDDYPEFYNHCGL